MCHKKAENLSATAGQGIEADVNDKHILGGNLKMMQERKNQPRRLRRTGSSACGTGQKHRCSLRRAKKLLGILGLADPLKPTSKEAVDSFHQMGIDVVMLTGDNKRTANTMRKISLGFRRLQRFCRRIRKWKCAVCRKAAKRLP